MVDGWFVVVEPDDEDDDSGEGSGEKEEERAWRWSDRGVDLIIDDEDDDAVGGVVEAWVMMGCSGIGHDMPPVECHGVGAVLVGGATSPIMNMPLPPALPPLA